MNLLEAIQAALEHPSPCVSIHHPEGYVFIRNENRTIEVNTGKNMKSHVFLPDNKEWEIFDLYLALN